MMSDEVRPSVTVDIVASQPAVLTTEEKAHAAINVAIEAQGLAREAIGRIEKFEAEVRAELAKLLSPMKL